MLRRLTALAISIIYITQVSSSQQNGPDIQSNLVLNNSSRIQSQGNIIQKSFNQFTKNRGLTNKLQQAVNLQKSQNIQSQSSQERNVQPLQFGNLKSQLSSNQQGVKMPPPTNLQPGITKQLRGLQSVNTQLPLNFQMGNTQASVNLQQPLNIQATLNLEPTGNVQQLPLQQPINLQQTVSPYQNSLEQNIQVQNQIPAVGNVQVLQIPEVSYIPNSVQFVQNYQGVNVPSYSSVGTSAQLAAPSYCINNSGGEAVPMVCPQNQQVSVSGVPSYIIERSQISSTIPASITYPTAQDTQPTLLTVLAVPQQNQQLNGVQNPVAGPQSLTETPNQITIVKSVQPSNAVSPVNQDQNLITVSPIANQLPTSAYPSQVPSINSLIASTLSQQASKSPNMRALLPLILNLIKEKNSCGCRHHCGCPNNQRNCEIEEDCRRYPTQRRNGYLQDEDSPKYNSNYSEESEDLARHKNGRNNKKNDKHKKVKPESDENYKEYDYSDEFVEDD